MTSTDIAEHDDGGQELFNQITEQHKRERLAQIDPEARRIGARLPAKAAELSCHEFIVLVLQTKLAIDDEDRAAFTVPF